MTDQSRGPVEPSVVVPNFVPAELATPIAGMPLTAAERRAIAALQRLPSGCYPTGDLAALFGCAGLDEALAGPMPDIRSLDQMRTAMGLVVRLIDAGWLELVGFFVGVTVDQERLRPLLEAIEAVEA